MCQCDRITYTQDACGKEPQKKSFFLWQLLCNSVGAILDKAELLAA
jgi:hypothetical protein